MKDETLIKKYYHVLMTLDRSDRPALSPDYEEELEKTRSRLEKMIDKRRLWDHPLLIKWSEAVLK